MSENEEIIIPDKPRENANSLSISEIKEIIPHRYPMLLVDRILDFEPMKWAIGIKCVSADEHFFSGHFPDYPVMPGVLQIEALAQTGAVAVLSSPENKGKIAFFGGIRNARFSKQVIPGDVLEMRVRLIKSNGKVGVADGKAYVNGKIACRGELTFFIQ
jgi:3-hydroxyacyl-[acyl-carrier-protein] dehydratase